MALPYRYYQIASTQWHFCIQCPGLCWAPNLHRWCKPLQGGRNWELWFVLTMLFSQPCGLFGRSASLKTNALERLWLSEGLQQPTPFQRFSAKVSTMRTPSTFQKTWWLCVCVWFWFLEGHKEGTLTKLFPLVWEIDPVSPQKKIHPHTTSRTRFLYVSGFMLAMASFGTINVSGPRSAYQWLFPMLRD